jgi:hypothetical protein
MAVSWTLEKELCGLVKAPTVGEALRRLGLADSPAVVPRLEEVHGWRRGDAETYLYRFRVIAAPRVRDVLLKAVTAFSPSRSLTDIAEEWVHRRQLLAAGGVSTPALYFAGRALVVEDYVGEKLAVWLRRNPGDNIQLTDQVFRLAAVMERHRFVPLCAFDGLRTDGQNVYVVDFGENLGPPGARRQRSTRLLREAKRWLADACVAGLDLRRADAVYAFHLEGQGSNGQRSC